MEALRDTWLMDGRRVKAGRVHTLPRAEANALGFAGKGKIVA
jgi:hypothetical protein